MTLASKTRSSPDRPVASASPSPAPWPGRGPMVTINGFGKPEDIEKETRPLRPSSASRPLFGGPT